MLACRQAGTREARSTWNPKEKRRFVIAVAHRLALPRARVQPRQGPLAGGSDAGIAIGGGSGGGRARAEPAVAVRDQEGARARVGESARCQNSRRAARVAAKGRQARRRGRRMR
jgi:hypothetical protein